MLFLSCKCLLRIMRGKNQIFKKVEGPGRNPRLFKKVNLHFHLLEHRFKLTQSELNFLEAYLNSGGDYGVAFCAYAKPETLTGLSDLDKKRRGSCTYFNITKKIGPYIHDYLGSCGLGVDRVVMEVEKGLTAKTNIYYKGELVDTVNDNQTQHKSRVLLADLHGLRKRSLEVAVGDNIKDLTAAFREIGKEEI